MTTTTGRLETFIKDHGITFPATVLLTIHVPDFNEIPIIAQSAEEAIGLVENVSGLAKATINGTVIYLQYDDGEDRPLYLLRLPSGELHWSDCNNMADYVAAFGVPADV